MSNTNKTNSNQATVAKKASMVQVEKVSKPKTGNLHTTPKKQQQLQQLPPLAIHTKYDKEEITSFAEAIEFYKKEFKKQIMNSAPFIKNKLQLAPYIINSRTGRIDDNYMMRFDYDNNANSSVVYNDSIFVSDNNIAQKTDRHINMAKFLLRQDFCDEIANHYQKYNIKCEFFDTGYDKKTRKYKRAFIKFTMLYYLS